MGYVVWAGLVESDRMWRIPIRASIASKGRVVYQIDGIVTQRHALLLEKLGGSSYRPRLFWPLSLCE